jgi:hypothetical protein
MFIGINAAGVINGITGETGGICGTVRIIAIRETITIIN